jgi:formamidopyrimidine-DNA glycosylase
MPELPEVETNVRAIRPHLLDRKINGIEFNVDKLRHPLQAKDFNPILDQPIRRVFRRAKYILIEATETHLLMIHLGMTGSFRLVENGAEKQAHEHIAFRLDDGKSLYFRDPRRFGMCKLISADVEMWPKTMRQLGPEPFANQFSGDYLYRHSRQRKQAVKTFIMDQRLVTGVGNIYASEALWRARIHPHRAAGRISYHRYEQLHREIVAVLTEAIAVGGTTIADYQAPDGREGRFSIYLQAYDRAGEKCRRCQKQSIRRTVLGGRSTYYCPACQR